MRSGSLALATGGEFWTALSPTPRVGVRRDLHVPAAAGVRPHPGLVRADGVAPGPLRRVERRVRGVDERAEIAAVVREDRDADGDGDPPALGGAVRDGGRLHRRAELLGRVGGRRRSARASTTANSSPP